MAFPTPVNGQITDTLSQTALMTLGTAGSTARGLLWHSVAQTLALSADGARAQSEATQMIADAALTAALTRMTSKGGKA